MQGTLEFVLQSARAVMASLALSYEVETGTSVNEAELKCMAENIYFESRAEPMMGKIAIGHVVMNRIEDERFPNTICEVVHQGPVRESWKTRQHKDLPAEKRIYYPIKNRCQFSWWCDGKSDIPEEIDSWYRALDIARLMIDNEIGLGLTDGADHYHADYIDPSWNDHMILITTIGNHKFYKSIR